MTMMPVTMDYPQRLIDARREGRVTFAGRIAIDGSLLDLRVVSSDHPDLVEAAMASVESARWESARLRGNAVEVPMTIVVQFVLQPGGPIPGSIIQSLAFAPAQGQVTRGKLRRQLEDVREYAEDEFDDLRKKARKELRRRIG